MCLRGDLGEMKIGDKYVVVRLRGREMCEVQVAGVRVKDGLGVE